MYNTENILSLLYLTNQVINIKKLKFLNINYSNRVLQYYYHLKIVYNNILLYT